LIRRRDFLSGSAALAAYAQVRSAEALEGTRRALPGTGGVPVLPQIVATGGELPSNINMLSTALGFATRFQGNLRQQIGYGGVNAAGMKLVLPGYYWPGSAELAIPNALPVQCAVYIPTAPGTKLVQITWGGKTQGSITPGVAECISDALLPSSFGYSNGFPANTVFYFKFLYDCVVGVANFSGVGRDVIDNDCQVYYGNAATYTSQILVTGALSSVGATGTGNSANPSAHVMKPLAWIGVPSVPSISVLSLGDSIMQGQLGSAFTNIGAGGYWSNGLMNANGACVPWASLARFGTSAVGYQANAVLMKALYKYATHAVCEFGSNDGTAAVAYAALQSIWADLKSHTGSTIGRVEQTFITARNSSTDGWATIANQTYTNGSLRDPLNTDIIDNVGANGLDAVLDIQGSWHTTTVPGWSAGSTSQFPVTGVAGGPTVDGTHPTDNLSRAVMARPVTARAVSWLQSKVTLAPVRTALPLILGARYQGATLAVTSGTWGLGASAYNTLAYQWKSAGVVIVSATSSTYTLQAGDVGNMITCDVTATNGIGSTTGTAAATATVLASAPPPPSFPAASAVYSSANIVNGTPSGTASFANVGQAGSQTDPLGGSTANKITYSTTANNQKVVLYALATVNDNTRYTASIYAKAVEYQYFYLQSVTNLSGYTYTFDALNGLVVSGNLSGTPPYTPDQVGIIAEPNGWWRAFITFTSATLAGAAYQNGINLQFGPMATNSGNTSLPGAGTAGSGMLFWRVQLATGGIDS
jgi:hypothetical protein